MEDGEKMRDPQAYKIAMDLHLAKFNFYMAKKDWKSAVGELQMALNAVVEILDSANKTLRNIADRYQQHKKVFKVEGSLKTEQIAENMLLVEYPGEKVVLRRITN